MTPSAELLALPKFGSGIGLHRMRWALDHMPRPEWLARLDAIKVTGSKGKGSTSALCAAILAALGVEAGLYTSPHLFRFHERIRLAGVDIADDALAASWRATHALLEAYRALHPADAFAASEAFTLVALHAFAERGLATAVCEAGIGGRYDSTRTIPGLTVALTSVELEHADLLGATPELIAFDKADLCPAGGTLVVGALDPELVRRLRGYCAVRGVSLVEAAARSRVSRVELAGSTMTFALESEGVDFGRVAMPLLGAHQAANAAVAVVAVRHWLSRNRPHVGDAAFRTAVVLALASVRWPGRLERVHDDPHVLVDVGHTPASMRAVASTVRQLHPSRPILLLTGVSIDKDAAGILAELLPLASLVICTRPHHKGTPAAVIAAECRRQRPDLEVLAIDDIAEATAAGLARAASDGMLVLVAGGLFLAAEAAVAIRGGDPAVLRFA